MKPTTSLSKWTYIKIVCRVYIEHYRLLAFLRPVLKLHDRIRLTRQPKIVCSIKPEKLVSVSEQVLSKMTGNLNFNPPPPMLEDLKKAKDDLKNVLDRYNRKQSETSHEAGYLSWIKGRVQMVLRMLF